MVPEK
jgi:hypothetical protein